MKLAWHDAFKHLDILAVPDLAVTNARRLVHARTGLEPDNALSLVLEPDPSLENVDELERDSVNVWLAREFGSGSGSDDMSYDATLGGFLDAEIAILKEERSPRSNVALVACEAMNPRVVMLVSRLLGVASSMHECGRLDTTCSTRGS